MLGRARTLAEGEDPRAHDAFSADALLGALRQEVLTGARVEVLFTRDPSAPIAGEVRTREEVPR
jgi:hypothetical protein